MSEARVFPGAHVLRRGPHRHCARLLLFPLAFAFLLAPLAPALAGFDEQATVSGESLLLANLVGEVRLIGHDGDAFELAVRVRGDDATRENVTIDIKEGDRAEVFIAYPVERKTTFVYPGMGRGSETSFSVEGDSRSLLEQRLEDQGAERIRIRGSGRGLEMWADVTLKVPAGKNVRVEVGAGEISAEDVDASVDLDVWTGHVGASNIGGDLRVDTGSGHVEAEHVRGEVEIDTGSGHVTLLACDGPDIVIDTGSGHVEAEDIVCRSLEIDTGSGHVTGRAVSAERAKIDTGSGRVRLDLERMGDGPYHIDTGSGGIALRLPSDASAHVSADTGSGHIRVDIEGARVYNMEDDEVEFEIGDGHARVDLDTGSGGIKVSMR